MTSTLPTNRPRRRYRYGSKPTWEVVLDAVLEFGRPVAAAEVGERIAQRIPDFARANLGPDLSVLSVNCNSRGNHGVNSKPRRSDSGNAYDRLVRIGKGQGVRFTEYSPALHGIWELADVGDKVPRPRCILSADTVELEAARLNAAAEDAFSHDEDTRRRILAAIVQREGQPEFRRNLLDAYSCACVVTGCTVESLLEAAHIVPYRGAHTNVVSNGLLLRADIHKLFDLHLLWIDPKTRQIRLDDTLLGSEYGHLEGRRLREPNHAETRPQETALEYHEQRCAGALLESGDVKGLLPTKLG